MKEWKRRLPFANICIRSGDIHVWKMYANEMTDDVIHSTQYYMEQKEIFENSKQHFSSNAGYLFMS